MCRRQWAIGCCHSWRSGCRSMRTTLGCINFYGTQSATLQGGAVEMAELFAAEAAIALGPVIRPGTVDHALTTRGDIGKAVGLTMARFELPADLALQLLVRASLASHVALADVARVVVGEAGIGAMSGWRWLSDSPQTVRKQSA